MSTAVIPEPIAQLQRQLEQIRSTQPRVKRLPDSLWQAAVELAREHGVYSVAHPSAAGLYGVEETARRSFPAPRESTQADIRRTDGDTFSDAGRVLDRVRVVARGQGAYSVESCRIARLDEPAAGLAGNREMIQITAQMRVLVAIERVDGRKGIDSLVRLCQEKLTEDPFSGCVFVFRSRSGTSIRLLSYDGQGYWLAQKRLSKGTLRVVAGRI